MIHLSPYLFFTGNCREALTFYQNCLDGELSLQRFGDSPAAAHLPAETQDYIMHGTLASKDFLLMASDTGRLEGTLTMGNNMRLSLQFDNEAKMEAAFAQLSAGGQVIDPLTSMPGGSKFGTLTDQFGLHWLFYFQPAANH
jgi:PhnB protein